MLLAGCSPALERTTRRDLDRIERELAPIEEVRDRPTPDTSEAPDVELDGSLQSYLAYAYAHSPTLRASFEQWRAASYGPRQARKLPEPVLTYAIFIRSVETRVGPQRHKLGVSQWFPWPTRLTQAGKAAALRAKAAQRAFEAQALEIARRVARAYWTVWRVERVREVESERVEILTTLSEQMKVRLEVGRGTLADVSRVDLRLSRSRDVLAGLDEQRARAAAELVREIGAPPGTPTPIDRASPTVTLPAEGPDKLRADAMNHPRVDALQLASDAAGAKAKAAKGSRLPSFGVGVDWIITGKGGVAAADAGKDAVIAMGMISLPLWQRSYSAAVKQAEAEGAALRARKIAAQQDAAASVDAVLADLRDAERRVRLYDTTLIPQAESTWSSVMAAYQSGQAPVADLLGAEAALLELRRAQVEVTAIFATTWSDLEAVVGRPVPARGVRQ